MNNLNNLNGNNPNGNNLNGNNPDNKIEIITEIIIGVKSNALDAKDMDTTGEIAQITNKIGNKTHRIITIIIKIIGLTMEDKMVNEILDQIMEDGEVTIIITTETIKMIITPSEM